MCPSTHNLGASDIAKDKEDNEATKATVCFHTGTQTTKENHINIERSPEIKRLEHPPMHNIRLRVAAGHLTMPHAAQALHMQGASGGDIHFRRCAYSIYQPKRKK
jgi:hypothetical protein